MGYQTLQSLLLDFCKWLPTDSLLNALLDMLTDGKFDMKEKVVIKVGEKVVIKFALCRILQCISY